MMDGEKDKDIVETVIVLETQSPLYSSAPCRIARCGRSGYSPVILLRPALARFLIGGLSVQACKLDKLYGI